MFAHLDRGYPFFAACFNRSRRSQDGNRQVQMRKFHGRNRRHPRIVFRRPSSRIGQRLAERQQGALQTAAATQGLPSFECDVDARDRPIRQVAQQGIGVHAVTTDDAGDKLAGGTMDPLQFLLAKRRGPRRRTRWSSSLNPPSIVLPDSLRDECGSVDVVFPSLPVWTQIGRRAQTDNAGNGSRPARTARVDASHARSPIGRTTDSRCFAVATSCTLPT